MQDHKLNQLFSAARKEPSPSPEPGFENLVLTAIRRESRPGPEAGSLLDQLGALFPRVAWATAAVVGLCVAVDFGLGAMGLPGLADSAAQISEQWFLTANEFGL